MRVKLKPFNTPNFVIQEMPNSLRQDGLKDPPSFALKELEADVLSDLCEEFRKEIFRKAEKKDPRLK